MSISPVKGTAQASVTGHQGDMTSSLQFTRTLKNQGATAATTFGQLHQKKTSVDVGGPLSFYAQQFGDQLVSDVRDSLAFQIGETGLECPELEGNPIFKNLRNRLRLFFFQQEDHRRS